MAFELDAEQIEGLALVPVGAGHHWRDARGLLVSAGLEAQPLAALDRIQQVHQLEALLALQPIDHRQIDKASVADLGANALERRHQLGQGHVDRDNSVRADAHGLRREHGRQTRIEGRHQAVAVPFCGMLTPGGVCAPCRAARLSAAMRSFSLMSESSNASGVGGQPGTYTSTGTILSTPWISA